MTATAPTRLEVDLEALAAIERRVLWLAVRIVDYANRERPKGDALKVGGHQASSASMVTLMTALYLADLRAEDRVSVKPHASPVLHAIEYLLGRLDRSYLTRLRDFGGLQSYPSRTKDPYPVDYSTGSVGLGSAAPLFGALADRFTQTRLGASTGGRFISLLGDAELDEGNIWEALADPLTRRLGNVLWIVDLNRQSLDRVIPGIRAAELEAQFRANGWDVIELKYGRRLREAYAREGGDLLRRRIDEMPNEQYQSLFGASEEVVRATVLDGADAEERAAPRAAARLLRGRGGAARARPRRPRPRRRARRASPRPRDARPADRGLRLHDQGLRPRDRRAAAEPLRPPRRRADRPATRRDGVDRGDRVGRAIGRTRAEGELLAAARRRLDRGDRGPAASVPVPATLSQRDPAATSTQAAFGRTLLDLSRVEGVAERLVTVAPDVSSSTNLGGFINKTGVWGPDEEPVYDAMEDSPLKWRVGPGGQHIEMGIAEMNLVLLLGQLGLSWDFQRERLFPIGTLYDPFVMRALEGIVYSTYSGSRFVLAGTPVRHLALPRRRRSPVALDARDRDRDSRAHLRRALLRTRARMAAARRARPHARRPTARRCTCGSRRPRSTRRPSPPLQHASATSGSGPTSSPAASGSASPARATTASSSPPAARSCPRRSPRPRCSPTRKASRRPCSASPPPTGSTATGRHTARRPCTAAPSRPHISSGS